MELFLDGLDELIEASEISVIELIGALQLTQQRVALQLLTDQDADEEAGE
jgi:hypothetical protein